LTDNPFHILGVDARFDLDADGVERAYLTRMSRLHPDVASGAPDALGRAALLNEARAVLADPERRAEALLAVLGGAGKTQDKSLPAGFLTEILETHEAVEAAAESGDAGEVARWREEAAARRRAMIDEVSILFAAARAGDAAHLKRVRERLNAWRYIERLVERLDAPERAHPPRD
jgi:molecular chaperone HscB